MVGTIIPMVHGKYIAGWKIPLNLVIYSIASVAGGLSAGAIVGYLSKSLAPRVDSSALACVMVGSVAIVGSFRESDLISVPLPESRWQVPREWLATQSPSKAVSLYGFSLGMGMLTRMNNCFYPVFAWLLLQRRPLTSILILSVFGIFRAIPLWVIYLARADSQAEYLPLTIRTLGQWQPAVRLFSAFALVSLGSLLVMGWCPYRLGS